MKVNSISLFLSIFIIILFFQSCVKHETKIACVGDSITEGYGLKNQGKTGYPVMLNQILGEEYKVFNFGRSATTLSQTGDFPYWITKEFSNVFASSPDIIIIKLGTNDTKPQNWDMEAYKKSYQAMIDTFNTIASNPKIILCKPVPVFNTRWGINDSTVVNGVIPIVEEIANENHLSIIDLYNGMQNQAENFPDDIHPNEASVKEMTKIVATFVLNLK